jgi:hypothetical protein
MKTGGINMKSEEEILKRLIDLDRLLRSQSKLTLQEIADKLNVTTRTVLRDFNIFKDIFNSTVINEKNGSRYEYRYADENFAFSDISLTEEEAFALQDARQLLQSLPLHEFYSKTLRGLDMLLERSKRFTNCEERHFKDKIIFTTDNSKAPTRPDLKPIEAVLHEALEKNLPVRISFHSPTGEDIIYEENFYPLLLVSFLGTWFLLAVKNASKSTDMFSYELPDELREEDFALLNYYDFTAARIISTSKERMMPEYYLKNENTVTHGAVPASMTYDENFRPILSFAFWFMDYRIELEYSPNSDTGRIEMIKRLPWSGVRKE